MPPRRRYEIRGRDGEVLLVPSLGNLHGLYDQGFLEDDDLVRVEGTTSWMRVGEMPALHGVREYRADPKKVMTLLVAAAVVAVGIGLLVLARLAR